MFTRRFFLTALLFASVCLPTIPSASAATEEEKRKAFLQTQRNGVSKASTPSAKKETTSKSTTPAKKKPKKRAKPKPSTKKKRSTRPSEATPRRTTPEPVKKSTPEPSTPTPAPSPSARSAQGSAVVIEKSGVVEEEPTPTPEPDEKGGWWWPFGRAPRYKYLTRSVRETIDDARVTRHRWRYIVVHNSGTRQGNAKAFDYYHRKVRKMPNGLAYHFVIGNGASSGNGAVEIGPRWRKQINGGHVHSDYLNSIALGICLVGDYNRDRPTPQQLEALDELVRYLRRRVGKTDHRFAIVKPHRDINPPQWPTDCPGDRFPYEWLNSHCD